MPSSAAFSTAAALAFAPISAAFAQDKPPSVIRDTEAEQLLRDYTRPILRAAGLEKQNIQVVIIHDSTFNAFVADGRRIFVNYGAIMQSETPNQLIGVLAHETGHLAGGHLAKMREQMSQAQTQMIIAMLLGAGAMVAGARSGNSNGGLSNAGAAAVAAPQEMIRRNLISYVRQQEENADRAGVKFLTATGQSAKGMYDTFKRFTNDSLFAAHGADPYLQSHPMPADRVAALEELAALKSLLGQEGRSGPADAPRHGAGQDLGLHGAAGHRLPALSLVERQPARALRACNLDLSARRSAHRARPDRRADPAAAQQPLFLRIARPGAAGRRQAGRGDRDLYGRP